jgi:tRNA pseudouridine32 synthase/23S rRNA pseudouridine746 synthase
MNNEITKLCTSELTEWFNTFKSPVYDYHLPEKFTFPFCYAPHPIAVAAAEELQDYIQCSLNNQHNFGTDSEIGGVGKMFGVLVVRDLQGQLGYLAAFSGKLGNSNYCPGFVPPVFDTHDEEGFYKKGEAETNIINRKIEALEAAPEYLTLKNLSEQKKSEASTSISKLKIDIREAKALRKQQRHEAINQLSADKLIQVNENLNQESILWHYKLKELNKYWKKILEELSAELSVYQEKIDVLKAERKAKSAGLQRELFEKYTFLNQYRVKKNLMDIFDVTDEVTPPSGAGECAAPKLLQYAFTHDLKPIAMAEFWWGKSPASEIRKHGNYYPACKSKCRPILGHMLEGIVTDENPMLANPAVGKEISIIMEDDYLLVVNKPAEFLSVPGKKIEDSVYTRMKERYPEATGPMIVHRLDMSTSGLMLVAKTKYIHQALQSQFIKRKIKKRYVALLEGSTSENNGEINLPIRVDLDNRPRQLVCYEYGKPAVTGWEVVEQHEGLTKVYFYPLTGRTHQLRVHASHPSGLGMPIKGDDLYGKKQDRLYLHAEAIEFTHPVSNQWVFVESKADF